MVAFNAFLKSIFLAVALGSSMTEAAPWNPTAKLSTFGKRTLATRADLKLESYHPASTYETYGAGLDHKHTKRQDVSIEESVVDFIAEKLSVDKSAINFRTSAKKESGKVAYVTQSHDNIPFANAVANVAFNSDNKVSSFGHSFASHKASIADSTPSVSEQDAIAAAESSLNAKYNSRKVTLEYLVKKDGNVALTHVVQLEGKNTFVEAFVDAHSKEVLQVTDFVAQATFNVLPIEKETPPEGFEVLTDPEDTTASPNGWVENDETNGPNAVAYIGSQSATTKASANGSFVFEWDEAAGPEAEVNQDLARTNAFYLVNTIHDYAYRYGFTPETFNFEEEDKVLISVQDSEGTNNAFFSTPPDGQSGQMAMFLWDITNPERDGSLENDIVTHEMTHGITNRMTGGGTGRCLQTDEAGGMGEGWSDAMADWVELKSANITDYVMGQWVTDDPAGIRTHPYSTDKSVNPLTYHSIAELNEVHAIGEVWANTLHVVSGALLKEYGFGEDAKTNPDGTEGNKVFLHLFLDALLIQPCNPTMPEARDAWIQADADRFDGANKCLLWNAFASRGLGQGAANFEDSSEVPDGC
ncbi:Fungalysin metallopeptidase-domain-containing protein [Flagelloscypha sp. PMI_526]|nr:Fungalysin metallopeptidase-domain-containing protein [Flagelloscypha sp. PMI_526]